MIKTIFKELKTIALTLIVCLVLGELVIRTYSSFVLNYDVEMHKYALNLKEKCSTPGVSHVHKINSESNLMGVNIRINENGFRDVYSKDKEENYLVQVIGSSITMGWGVPFDSVFTSKLDKFYNKKGVEFVNTGVGNYNTAIEEKVFYTNFNTIKPKEVWLHYYVNDAEVISNKSNSFILKHSYFAAFFYIKFKQMVFSKSGKISSIGEYYYDLYFENKEGWIEAQNAILRMKSFCDEHNVIFKILIQPDLHSFETGSPQEKVHLEINNFFDKNKIQYVDLYDSFKHEVGDEPIKIWVNPDDPHPNSTGHNIIFETSKKLIDSL